MKHLIFLFALLISVSSFGQTQFSNGWKDGYKKGYCNNDLGCIDPIPPAPPVPPIKMTNISDYKFGYNEGFQAGLRANSSNSSSPQVSAPDYKLSDNTMNSVKEASGDFTPDYSKSQAELRQSTNELASVINQQRSVNGWRTINKEEGRHLFTYVQRMGRIVRMEKLRAEVLEMVKKEALVNDFEYDVIEVFEYKAKIGVLSKVEVLIKVK